jgi:uncharacterized membrane protein
VKKQALIPMIAEMLVQLGTNPGKTPIAITAFFAGLLLGFVLGG